MSSKPASAVDLAEVHSGLGGNLLVKSAVSRILVQYLLVMKTIPTQLSFVKSFFSLWACGVVLALPTGWMGMLYGWDK